MGERDQAGTYVSLTASSPTGSAAISRRGGLAPAKYGLPPPRTNGGEEKRYSSMRPRSVRHPASSGPATSISPSTSAFSRRTNASTSPATSVAFAPTDLSERDTTHFGRARHTAAKS